MRNKLNSKTSAISIEGCMKTFIIKYYHTETQYRCGIVAYSETVRGSRDVAVNTAQGKIRVGAYKFYDIQEK